MYSHKHWRTFVKVAITHEIIGISQLLGALARAAPKVYAYGHRVSMRMPVKNCPRAQRWAMSS